MRNNSPEALLRHARKQARQALKGQTPSWEEDLVHDAVLAGLRVSGLPKADGGSGESPRDAIDRAVRTGLKKYKRIDHAEIPVGLYSGKE